METILIIPKELEYLEGLVKLARRKKDAEGQNQVVAIRSTPTMMRVNVKKTHRSKTLHLDVEINQAMIEGSVDTGASMSIMTTNVVRELA
jgi:predicted aspartyl protease